MKNKLLIYPIILIIFCFSVFAVDFNLPSTSQVNSNFIMQISGTSGLYVFEMSIPSGVSIISDPSNGVITDKYRTSYAGPLSITFISSSTGNKVFSNIQYTEGLGVINLASESITISSSTTTQPGVTTTTNPTSSTNPSVTTTTQSVPVNDCENFWNDPKDCTKIAQWVYWVGGGLLILLLSGGRGR